MSRATLKECIEWCTDEIADDPVTFDNEHEVVAILAYLRGIEELREVVAPVADAKVDMVYIPNIPAVLLEDEP